MTTVITSPSITEAGDELIPGTPAGESKSWNWHPDVPIQYSPLFCVPLKPLAILKWFANAWLPLTELGCYLLIAIIVSLWVQPPLSSSDGSLGSGQETFS
ncbi:MAG: hypothetical protein GKR95_19240 [Gammaproteobacteria bacterium]|nr:hypothetical protein [Gammaproteobacteria bacterium]